MDESEIEQRLKMGRELLIEAVDKEFDVQPHERVLVEDGFADGFYAINCIRFVTKVQPHINTRLSLHRLGYATFPVVAAAREVVTIAFGSRSPTELDCGCREAALEIFRRTAHSRIAFLHPDVGDEAPEGEEKFYRLANRVRIVPSGDAQTTHQCLRAKLLRLLAGDYVAHFEEIHDE